MKNPGTAAVLSFFIPGVGQIYNGEFLRGIPEGEDMVMMFPPVKIRSAARSFNIFRPLFSLIYGLSVLHVGSAIGTNNLAGNKLSLIGKQKGNHSGNIVWLADSRPGHKMTLMINSPFTGHVRINQSRRHYVNVDAFISDFAGQGF